jgi:flagellar hook-basal body complex protein FliE
MTAPIAPIVTAGSANPIKIASSLSSAGSEEKSTAFQSIFQNAVNAVEGSQQAANNSIGDFLSGNGEDIHSTVLAVQRASLTFDLFMQVRNKVVSAYQEVIRMQV